MNSEEPCQTNNLDLKSEDGSDITFDDLFVHASNLKKNRNFDANLPKSGTMKQYIENFFRHEYHQMTSLSTHSATSSSPSPFTFPFPSLPSYLTKDSQSVEPSLKDLFKPLKQINSPNLTAKYLCNSIVVLVRATNLDDIHKAMKYGIWGPEEEDVSTFKELLQRSSREEVKVVVLLG